MKDAMLYVAAGLLALLILAFFIYGRNQEQRYEWFTSYNLKGEQPYDLKFFHELIDIDRTVTDNFRMPVHKLLDSAKFADGNTDYLLIGESSFYDEKDIAALRTFISQGNNALIITEVPPQEILGSLLPTFCDQEFFAYPVDEKPRVKFNFYHPKFRKDVPYDFNHKFTSNETIFPWNHISPAKFCDTLTQIVPLGYQHGDSVDFVNFAAIPFGKGKLFIHTVPLAFTNYSLTKETSLEYVSSVLSHLDGDQLIWDELSKIGFIQNKNGLSQGPLYYILSQPALKYAWWMFLAAALLYVAFASKRKQRVIPVIEKKTNTSLEFLNVISSLHYQNLNHLDIARKKMKYFLYFIRAKYGMNLQTFGDEHVKKLSEKSNVPLEDVQQIADNFKLIEKYSISNEEPNRLINLYISIQRFYKNCK